MRLEVEGSLWAAIWGRSHDHHDQCREKVLLSPDWMLLLVTGPYLVTRRVPAPGGESSIQFNGFLLGPAVCNREVCKIV